jgi:hypothetical protein
VSILLQSGLKAPAASPDAEADRVSRLLARVDAELPSMTSGEQRRFLDRLIETWEARYARFIQTGGKSEFFSDKFNPVTAADFTMTIVGLAARRPEVER